MVSLAQPCSRVVLSGGERMAEPLGAVFGGSPQAPFEFYVLGCSLLQLGLSDRCWGVGVLEGWVPLEKCSG